MSVDTGITSSTSQVLVLTVGDVEVSLGVTVFLSQTKINNIDLVTTLSNTHEEVVGLDITVDEGFGVDVFDTRNELIGKKQHSLQRELAVAEVEKILQTGSKEVDDHSVVVTLGTEPTHEGNANTTGKGLVDAGFIFELGVLCFDALELDGDFFSRDDVGAYDD